MIHFEAIFLVDDDPINNLINKRLLGKTDISKHIYQFLEGEEALMAIAELPTDQQIMIFLDINMPVMNGWEFLNFYLEKFPKRKDKIVILSSSIDFQDRQKAMDYEVVSGFIEKPLTMEKINYQLSRNDSED
ncbi:MAG TPA: response regulator [Algoriphagus sp.]|jgi:CheY-like chemotaxis protein|uniref:response regulator n=1 Tax=unclassified Algoriphagus TaxID=2641541 RepID=UPI000C5FDD20|nr:MULTISPECIES: response regulator [unclassified Algoriphagus]MAL12875.1 response regulator [Algoriphagus sp.]QYH39148.1 response regulator [Algoriphagus sp. NBT04N3]HAD49999.1 response regulator [Algoriphagus sp.]HAH37810.1 response regulator [Algoriphagus sp.]HAS58412.1 response regulator [Algoriphagus sp.]|tara:strand:+ start:130 stop:525 length:396 start_codon:yes stop_codon:yes gene_type:complete